MRTRAQLIASALVAGGAPYYWLAAIDSWFVAPGSMSSLVASNDDGPRAA